MEYKIISGRYRSYPTHYYACLVDGKILLSTRKRDLPKVDAFFSVGRFSRRLLVFCPKHGRLEFQYIGPSSFYYDAARAARDCEEYNLLVGLFQAWPTAGRAALQGEKLGRLPRSWGSLRALSRLPREALATVLTERAQAELTARLLRGT